MPRSALIFSIIIIILTTFSLAENAYLNLRMGYSKTLVVLENISNFEKSDIFNLVDLSIDYKFNRMNFGIGGMISTWINYSNSVSSWPVTIYSEIGFDFIPRQTVDIGPSFSLGVNMMDMNVNGVTTSIMGLFTRGGISFSINMENSIFFSGFGGVEYRMMSGEVGSQDVYLNNFGVTIIMGVNYNVGDLLIIIR